MINREREILTKIKSIIQDCAQQNESLLRDQNRINDIELKLFLAKAHFLASHIEILQQVQQVSPLHYAKGGVGHIPVYGVNKEPFLHFKNEHLNPDEQLSGAPEKPDTAPSVSPTSSVKQPTFVVGAGSGLNDSMAKALADNNVPLSPAEAMQSVATIIEKQQTTIDLQATISLNDKWLFIKELFNGSTATYNEAVHLANKCESFEDAERFLQRNYGIANKWNDKAQTLEKFYALLGRRFPR